jgi:agmatinase
MTHQSTFAGFPVCNDITRLAADMAVIGIPHGTPYLDKPSRSERAPAAIREAAQRYAKRLDHYDFDLGGPLLDNRNVRVVDCGDVPGNPLDPEGNRTRATETLRSVVNAGAVPIVLGGDDSVPIPFFRAYKGHAPFTVVQVDAHMDWRHEVNGITEGYSSTMRRASEMDWIDGMIQVGLRGVGSARMAEVKAAQEYGARIVTAKAVHEKGIQPVVDLLPDDKPCLLTIDCDGLDPRTMPAVNVPAPGGLTYQQVIALIHGLTAKAGILGFDLVEFAPENDINGLGALTAARIVLNVIGSVARSRFSHS